jgi:hypothetical protein
LRAAQYCFGSTAAARRPVCTRQTSHVKSRMTPDTCYLRVQREALTLKTSLGSDKSRIYAGVVVPLTFSPAPSSTFLPVCKRGPYPSNTRCTCPEGSAYDAMIGVQIRSQERSRVAGVAGRSSKDNERGACLPHEQGLSPSLSHRHTRTQTLSRLRLQSIRMRACAIPMHLPVRARHDLRACMFTQCVWVCARARVVRTVYPLWRGR